MVEVPELDRDRQPTREGAKASSDPLTAVVIGVGAVRSRAEVKVRALSKCEGDSEVGVERRL